MKTFKIHTLHALQEEILLEDIRSKLNKLKNLSKKEKNKLLTFFKTNPHLESAEGNINWNNKNLVYSDFEDVIERGTLSKIKSNVKKLGLKGLREGKDYIDISEYFNHYNAYIALNFESSKMFGSEYIGTCKGKWCTSSNRPATWNYYNANKVVIVVIVSYDGKEKYALAGHPKLADIEIYGGDGKEVQNVPNENVKSVMRNNINKFQQYAIKAKQYVYKNVKWFTDTMDLNYVKYEITAKNDIFMSSGTWKGGTWVSGTFSESVWKKGTWRDGKFIDSIWWKGKWEHGDFKDSQWMDGIWVTGDFRDSVWENGDWLYGIWWSGEFNGGKFHDGIWVDGDWNAPDENWLGGMDQYRNIHEAGDSPNNW